MTADRPLPPGSSIGILGGGQLGRMLALAAGRLGLKVHIYSDVPDAPAAEVAAATSVGSFDDPQALGAFAGSVDVVTYEFENVPVAAAERVAERVPVWPPAEALRRTQDRVVEKELVAGLGIPVAPFAAVDTAADLAAAVRRIGLPGFLKSRRLGYDGKGQARIVAGTDPAAAFHAIGGVAAIYEGAVDFAFEVSVVAVRARTGELAFYDIPRNTHESGILRRSVVPAGLPPAMAERCRGFAARIAGALGYVGVIGVEMFYAGEGATEPVVVNEIAPRVHNSGHWTLDACRVSQFENHIRAVAGWPLGGTERHSDAEMVNLIGEEALDWQRLAATPATALHLYGKRDARPGRKMGHVTRLSPFTSA